MPEQNRVTPLGEIVAIPQRGGWTGNRGCIHKNHRIVRTAAVTRWIVCALEFKDRHFEQWRPGHLTWLFFHDEAVAFAAGHRPCAECRRSSYNIFRDAWVTAHGGERPAATRMDDILQAERWRADTRQRRFHPMSWAELPDGSFVLIEQTPYLVLGSAIIPWGPDGYGSPIDRPTTGEATVITPPATIGVLRTGYPIQIDPRAYNLTIGGAERSI